MDEAILKAEERLAYLSGDKEAIAMYEMRQKAQWDYNSGINFARREGIAEGINQANLEIAKKMKARGRPLNEIAEDTGLSAEAIETI